MSNQSNLGQTLTAINSINSLNIPLTTNISEASQVFMPIDTYNYKLNMASAITKPPMNSDRLKSIMNDVMQMCDLYEVRPKFRADLLKAVVEAYNADNAVVTWTTNTEPLYFDKQPGTTTLQYTLADSANGKIVLSDTLYKDSTTVNGIDLPVNTSVGNWTTVSDKLQEPIKK